jgi:transcription termination/antitermination protein NusG
MKRWYVVQVYAGYEEVVKKDLERQAKKDGLQELLGAVLVPSAKTAKFFDADQKDADQQLFPGYVLVEMELTPATMRLVTDSMRVLRFLGGKEPTPISKKEIDRVLRQITGEIEVGLKKEEFTVGSEVEIIDGPFAGFVGIVEAVDVENEKLTVMVGIFGRMTPVELGFQQVKR